MTLTNAIQTNRFITETMPWQLAKDGDRKRLNEVIYLAAESLRIIAILLQPFMPGKAADILDWLGVADDSRTFAHAELQGDLKYGTPKHSLPRGAHGNIFPPLPVEN